MFNNQKGFTLIELMVVVVIIGILAAIALPNFLSMQDRAKESEIKANSHTLQLSVEDYKTQNNGSKPTAIANAPAPAPAASNTVYVPSTLKNPFNTALTGQGCIRITAAGAYPATVAANTAAAANGAGIGNLNYDQAAAQTTAYFISGWAKNGTLIGQLTEGQ